MLLNDTIPAFPVSSLGPGSEHHVGHPPPGGMFEGRAGSQHRHQLVLLTLGPPPTDLIGRGTHQRRFFRICWFACGANTLKDVSSVSSFCQ